MNIGDVAEASGVSARLIRCYESIDLIRKAGRTGSGYRLYDDSDVQTLRFIRRARSLGFSIKKIEQLLALWHDRSRASAEVRSVALAHVDELEIKILELRSMADTLRKLASSCRNDSRPDCPILEDLAETKRATASAVGRRKKADPPGALPTATRPAHPRSRGFGSLSR